MPLLWDDTEELREFSRRNHLERQEWRAVALVLCLVFLAFLAAVV